MDSSLHSANLTTDEVEKSLTEREGDIGNAEVEEEHHVHLPNPSLWPLLLSVAILITITGILFFPSTPWLTVIGAPLVLVGILGWALEDPLKALGENVVPLYGRREIPSRFQIGQEVIDKDGYVLGMVQARFPNYILVERGGLFIKAYYIPQNVVKSNLKKNVALLTMSEQELIDQGYNSVPNDLYDDEPDYGFPDVTGIAQFSRRPLSPAETGHYNYGPNFPGVNTDASGSYHPEEVRPAPQRYVGERRKVYATSKVLPPRPISPD